MYQYFIQDNAYLTYLDTSFLTIKFNTDITV